MIISYLITETGRFVYRPWAYENEINDFGLADSIGNLGGIVVQIFFALSILNPPKKKGPRIIGFMVIGYILYEVLQPVLPRGVFDWKDVSGTLVGGLIAFILWWGIQKLMKNKVLYKF
jgi:hypothetical protein